MRSVSFPFYKTRAWKECRDAYLRKVGGLCELCMDRGIIKPADMNNMEAVASKVKFDFLTNLGDLTNGDTPKDATIQKATDCLSRAMESHLPIYFAIGNHDDNRYASGTGNSFTITDLYSTYSSYTRPQVFDDTGTNYFVDFE